MVIELTRTFTQSDYDTFARLSGDDNPIHVDPEFAAKTRFGRTLAHGMMLFSVLNGAVRRAFETTGMSAVELMFPGPTYVGDQMRIVLALIDGDLLRDGRATVSAQIIGPDGTVACDAKLVVMR